MAAAKNVLSVTENPETGATNRSKAKIREIEELLYRRARVAPREPRGPTDTELAIAQEKFENKTQRQVTVAMGVLAQSAAGAAHATFRAVQNLTDKVDLHSLTLVNLQDDIANLRRVLKRFDLPMAQEAMHTNPTLNPALNQYVPFDHQVLTKEFFQSQERVTALSVYILNTVKWDPAHFIYEAVAMTCTYNYREKHSFPATSL